VAALIKSTTGLETELVVGGRGEFTVWVDGRRVAEKTADGFPEDQQAASAVQQAVGAR
jgi:hypothetical protein